jgi:hypothetical protein
MTVIGKFLVKESFTITRVGFTIVGELVEGKVNRGNRLTIDTGSGMITLTILHIDLPNRPSDDIPKMGLRFSEEHDQNNKTLAGLKIPEQLVEIVGETHRTS